MKQLAQFDDAWMSEFRKRSRITDDSALEALRAELIEVGRHYRRIIETTPCDLIGSPFDATLTQRGEWLKANVVNPAKKLLFAIHEDQAPWFSTWPYEHEFDELPARAQLHDDLERILTFSEKLVANLRGEQSWDAPTNQELRFYIFKDCYVAIRKHLPHFKPTQSKYAKPDDEETARFVDSFSEAMRHVYAEITGKDEQLVRLIRMVITDPDWDY